MTPEELIQIAEDERESRQKYKYTLSVCTAVGCLSSHGDKVVESLTEAIKKEGREEEYLCKGVGCLGLCSEGPLVLVEPDGLLYGKVKPEDAEEIIQSLGKEPVSRLLVPTDIPFFQKQEKIVLENSGKIDPTRLEDYIAADGYDALIQVITEMTPDEVIEEIVHSGLRGRGGAGYPTGLKWSTVAKGIGDTKYVVCNADEGDPGAFMDRSVLESDPHRVLEGMAIAAYAIGATLGYIYVRAEYPLAIERLQNAIKQAERAGLLGNHICSTTFGFSIQVRLGAGAFVCGEETALLASIEGKRGVPRPRPPYPAVSGLWGCPTLINNVETFANIAPIIRKGAEWYANIGTEKSKGTKVFALAGRVNHTGLIEIPMGVSLREIIFEIGGGIPEDRQFKAIQTGGPSGGCIPEQHLDVSVDYESLNELGAIMGSGGMIVMDETSSMVDVAKFFMEFCMTESCGKCVPCRVGTAQIYNFLCKIMDGRASPDDLEFLEKLCNIVKEASLCGLGQTAPNPVLSTLRYFRHEYLDYIVKKDTRAEIGEALSTKEA